MIFPTNPDLADILGDTDFDFDNFHFLDFLDPEFPDLQVPGFQNSQISWFPALLIQGCQLACLMGNWPEKPSGPQHVDFLLKHIDD